MHRPLDPRIVNVCLDANALDRSGTAADVYANRIEQLMNEGTIRIVMPRSVRGEVLHPNTPRQVQAAILPQLFTLHVERTADEYSIAAKIRHILQGNAKPGKHDADASHLAEAAKYGAGYFITSDSRLLNKRSELAEALPPSMHIVTPAEFVGIYERYTQ